LPHERAVGLAGPAGCCHAGDRKRRAAIQANGAHGGQGPPDRGTDIEWAAHQPIDIRPGDCVFIVATPSDESVRQGQGRLVGRLSGDRAVDDARSQGAEAGGIECPDFDTGHEFHHATEGVPHELAKQAAPRALDSFVWHNANTVVAYGWRAVNSHGCITSHIPADSRRARIGGIVAGRTLQVHSQG